MTLLLLVILQAEEQSRGDRIEDCGWPLIPREAHLDNT